MGLAVSISVRASNHSIQFVDSDSGSSSDNDGSSKSKSGSGSESESKSTTTNSSPSKTNQKYVKAWEENPDVYGIRRSGRSRKEPERLKVAESDSSDKGRRKSTSKKSPSKTWNSDSTDYDSSTDRDVPPPRSKPPSRRTARSQPKKRPSPKKATSNKRRSYSSSEESNYSSDDDKSKRSKSRRGATVSYKEDSEDKTDSDDLVDVEYAEPDPAAVDNAETIERVLAQRRGKKGAHEAKENRTPRLYASDKLFVANNNVIADNEGSICGRVPGKQTINISEAYNTDKRSKQMSHPYHVIRVRVTSLCFWSTPRSASPSRR
ncbi:transcriptional regulator [Homalodisca vitripennis]|nr:transcriptional regulator [Homalodisca vitripennis]